jgi:hypothetical protein
MGKIGRNYWNFQILISNLQDLIFLRKIFSGRGWPEGSETGGNSPDEGYLSGQDAILSSFLLVETAAFVKRLRLSRDFQPVPGRLSLIPTNL